MSSTMTKKVTHVIKKYLMITAGAFIYALGISLILDPNRLAPGGVTGIAIMVSRFTPIATGTWILIFNIPLLVFGWWKFGTRFIFSTVYATVMTSVFANMLAFIRPLSSDLVVAAVLGSILVGGGIGLVFRAGATSGGTDIIVKVLRLRFPHLKTGALFMLTDMTIVVASGFVFQDVRIAVYAGVVVMLNSYIMDLILYGQDEAKLLYIISDQYQQITDKLLIELDSGVTYLQGTGAYTDKDKKVILCAVRKQQSPKVIAIVKDIDPIAFLIVSSANEIFGEGYKSYNSLQL